MLLTARICLRNNNACRLLKALKCHGPRFQFQQNSPATIVKYDYERKKESHRLPQYHPQTTEVANKHYLKEKKKKKRRRESSPKKKKKKTIGKCIKTLIISKINKYKPVIY